MKTLVYFIFVFCLFFSCNPDKPAKEQTQEKLEEKTEELIEKDKVERGIKVPRFLIEITLSEKAQKKLNADSEKIIVSAMLIGQSQDKSLMVEDGYFTASNKDIELTDTHIANFNNWYISPRNYEQLVDKDNYEININVYSARKSSENNLLSCDMIQKKIDEMKGKTHTLHCKLIEE